MLFSIFIKIHIHKIQNTHSLPERTIHWPEIFTTWQSTILICLVFDFSYLREVLFAFMLFWDVKVSSTRFHSLGDTCLLPMHPSPSPTCSSVLFLPRGTLCYTFSNSYFCPFWLCFMIGSLHRNFRIRNLKLGFSYLNRTPSTPQVDSYVTSYKYASGFHISMTSFESHQLNCSGNTQRNER